MSAKKTA